MDVQVAALCDAASDYGGKLCLLGVFDTIIATRLPAIQPQLAVVLRVLFRRDEEGTHPVQIHFVDADGRHVIPPLNAVMEVRVPDDLDFATRNLILNVQGARFDGQGPHAVDVMIADRQVASIPLTIRMLGQD